VAKSILNLQIDELGGADWCSLGSLVEVSHLVVSGLGHVDLFM
jgi:hypothetical protein